MRHETLVGNPHGKDPEKKPGNKAHHAQIFNWNDEFAKLSPEEQQEFAPVMEQLRAKREANQNRPSELAEIEKRMNLKKATEVREEIHKAPSAPRHPVQLDIPVTTPEQMAEWQAKEVAKKKGKGLWSGIKNLFN